MGKDGRRSEREPKFLAVIFLHPIMERFWKTRENRAESFSKAIPFLSRCTVMKRKMEIHWIWMKGRIALG